jgi:Holliday junction resolvasome RuvABC DNA-binding subunit
MDQYYVYQHIDPETGEILYIGMGSYERAWLCRGSNRKKNHQERLNELFSLGYTMQDVVSILASYLSKEAALSLELTKIEKFKPKFNNYSNPNWKYPSKFADEVITMVKALKEMGYGPQNTAFLMGGDKNKNAMTMWRMVNE